MLKRGKKNVQFSISNKRKKKKKEKNVEREEETSENVLTITIICMEKSEEFETDLDLVVGLTRPCRNPWPRDNERHDPSDIFHLRDPGARD